MTNDAATQTPEGSGPDPRYTVGTLTYSRAGLTRLFCWLLWGDFCFMLMETIVPSIVPLKLRGLDAPNWIIALIMTTLPGVLNMTVCPWVSFKSDRHRSPRGRRIPFILSTLPFLSLFLLLIGFSEHIGRFIHGLLPADTSLSVAYVTVLCIGACVVGFQFFNMFVNSVFWYLFNDVVPQAFLGRFSSLFRLVAQLKVVVYSFFIFPYAESHMTEIFVGTTLLYAVGFGLMCLRVKEGEYPPPPPTVDGKTGWLAQAKTFVVESYSHKMYWYMFLMNASMAISGTIGVFSVFFYQSVGLDLAKIGMIAGTVSVVNMLLTYPAGALADRTDPVRVVTWVKLINLFVLPLSLIWLFVDFTPTTAFVVMILISAINLPFNVLAEALFTPMQMHVLPKDRYGQFCAAQSLVRSTGTMLGGLAAGMFLDFTKHLHGGTDFGYRYLPVWQIFWAGTAMVFLVLLRNEWVKRPKPEPEKPIPAPALQPSDVEAEDPVTTPLQGAAALP